MPQQGSPPGQLHSTDWRKIGKGLGIALAGSGLAYVGQQVVPGLDSLGMGWLAPFAAVLVNTGLKWASDTQQGS